MIRGMHAPHVLPLAPRRTDGDSKLYWWSVHARTFAAGRRKQQARGVRSPKGGPAPIRISRWIVICSILLFFAACRQDMYDQPKAKTYSASDFFPDGTSARPISRDAVEFHSAPGDEGRLTGLTNGILGAQLPVKLTLPLVQRGQERYDIYCAVCHGATGDGQGEVVQRGYPAPPTYHSDRLRNAPIGHFYDVITNGYGVMYSYASRVEPDDRWAIASYIRALQLSQQAPVNDLSPDEKQKLEKYP